MSADRRLRDQIKAGIWRPHVLTPVGTVLAAVVALGLTALLVFARPELESWLAGLKTGGLAGGSTTPDRMLGLRISAGFCAMMTVVGSVMIVRARRIRQRLFAALDGEPGVVWIYREQADLGDRAEHILVFGLDGGEKVRATVAAEAVVSLWDLAVAAFPGVSQGHDTAQERRFAVRPRLMLSKPRQIADVQLLKGRERAR
ncbi:MAG: hypothetical protein KC502_04385 [Myxococcales bacterium]|nr:hypothetical protein [Myxococcales bacterium]